MENTNPQTNATSDAVEQGYLQQAPPQQAQPFPTAAPPQSTPAAQATPAPEHAHGHPVRLSPFRNSANFAAGSITKDDTTYWYSEPSDALKEWVATRYEWVANKLGITLEQLQDEDFEKANAEEFAKFPGYVEETYELMLAGPAPGIRGVLVKWDAVDDWGRIPPITLDNIHLLGNEVKADIIAQVQRSAKFGISFDSFRRASS